MRRKPHFPYVEFVSERKLRHVDIEITKKCNLSCVHCSAQSNLTGKELRLNKIEKILHKASSLGLENVGFTGGEPLILRNKLMALLKYCKRTLNSKTHFHTNGTMLKLEDAAIMARLTDEVTVTLLGSNPETHDKITCVKGCARARVRKNGFMKKKPLLVGI